MSAPSHLRRVPDELRRAPRRPPAARGWTKALAALAAVMLAATVTAFPVRAQSDEGPRAAAERVLGRIPAGSRATQAAWILASAREQADARVAFQLVEEALRRGEGPIVVEARLWKVRYWMAAGRTDDATRELRLIPALPAGASGDAERRFWAALAGERSEPPEGAPSGAPPWELLAQLASLRPGELAREQMRFALSLEGAARRWGLLGAWLWRLQESGQSTLARVAREIARSAPGLLAGSPERAALLEEAAARPQAHEPGARETWSGERPGGEGAAEEPGAGSAAGGPRDR